MSSCLSVCLKGNSFCFCSFFSVSFRFFPFLSASFCFFLFLFVSIRFFLFLFVYVCFFLFLFVSFRLFLFNSFLFLQKNQQLIKTNEMCLQRDTRGGRFRLGIIFFLNDKFKQNEETRAPGVLWSTWVLHGISLRPPKMS